MTKVLGFVGHREQYIKYIFAVEQAEQVFSLVLMWSVTCELAGATTPFIVLVSTDPLSFMYFLTTTSYTTSYICYT